MDFNRICVITFNSHQLEGLTEYFIGMDHCFPINRWRQ